MTELTPREKLRRALNVALRRTGPCSRELMATTLGRIAPHVTSQEALLERIYGKLERVVLAVPATLIAECCNVVELSADQGGRLLRTQWTEASFTGSPVGRLDWWEGGEPDDRYYEGADALPVLIAATDNISFFSQAIGYCRRNWRDQLQPVKAAGLLRVRVLDSREMPRDGMWPVAYDSVVAIGTTTFELLEHQQSPWAALDRVIQMQVNVQADPVSAAELQGNGGYRLTPFNYCICGGPFNRCGCSPAGLEFVKQHPKPAPFPMSAAIIRDARHFGCDFTGNPEAAVH
jgi:hypothetical protein